MRRRRDVVTFPPDLATFKQQDWAEEGDYPEMFNGIPALAVEDWAHYKASTRWVDARRKYLMAQGYSQDVAMAIATDSDALEHPEHRRAPMPKTLQES